MSKKSDWIGISVATKLFDLHPIPHGKVLKFIDAGIGYREWRG
jgi:hypothetical protein